LSEWRAETRGGTLPKQRSFKKNGPGGEGGAARFAFNSEDSEGGRLRESVAFGGRGDLRLKENTGEQQAKARSALRSSMKTWQPGCGARIFPFFPKRGGGPGEPRASLVVGWGDGDKRAGTYKGAGKSHRAGASSDPRFFFLGSLRGLLRRSRGAPHSAGAGEAGHLPRTHGTQTGDATPGEKKRVGKAIRTANPTKLVRGKNGTDNKNHDSRCSVLPLPPHPYFARGEQAPNFDMTPE